MIVHSSGLRAIIGLAFVAWLGGMPVGGYAVEVDADGCTKGEQIERESQVMQARLGSYKQASREGKEELYALLERFAKDWDKMPLGRMAMWDHVQYPLWGLATADQAEVWVRLLYCKHVCVMRPPLDKDYSAWLGECDKACDQRHPWPAE